MLKQRSRNVTYKCTAIYHSRGHDVITRVRNTGNVGGRSYETKIPPFDNYYRQLESSSLKNTNAGRPLRRNEYVPRAINIKTQLVLLLYSTERYNSFKI